MGNKMVDIGTPEYEIWINAESQIALILSVRRADMSDDASKSIIMLSTLRIDGVYLDSPLPPGEVIKRIKRAQGQVVPGVTNYPED